MGTGRTRQIDSFGPCLHARLRRRPARRPATRAGRSVVLDLVEVSKVPGLPDSDSGSGAGCPALRSGCSRNARTVGVVVLVAHGFPGRLQALAGGKGDGSGGSGRLRRRRRVLARCRRSGRLGGRHLAGFWSLRVLDLAGQDLGRLRRGGVGRRWRCVRCRGHWQARRGQVAALALGGAFARSAGAWQGFASQDAFSVEEGA